MSLGALYACTNSEQLKDLRDSSLHVAVVRDNDNSSLNKTR